MMGSSQPKVMAEFYEKVLERKPDMAQDGWYGWKIGSSFLSISEHSEVKEKAQEPARIILNFETSQVKEEFARIKDIAGVSVIKEPYGLSPDGSPGDSMWIATLADPDGNYFQLATPWEG